MKSILLIIPYFGKWPIWFEAYLCSIASNDTIHWLCPTDCVIPENHPKNITFLPTSLKELNNKVNEVLGLEVPLTPKKLCDLKPAYAVVFKEQVVGYDFWGFCDMDIIWGNIRKFITPEILNNFDIVTSLNNMISGHFTLFKNTSENAVLFKKDNTYQEIYKLEKHLRFDEILFTKIIAKIADKKEMKILWNTKEIEGGIESEAHQEYFLDRWLYKNGEIIDLYSSAKKEYMYLHFINWKRTMRTSEVRYIDKPDQFYVSCTGMHYKRHSKMSVFLNIINNIFDGYWIREKRRRRKQKMTSLIKRVKRKLKLN